MLTTTGLWKAHGKDYDVRMKLNFTDVFLDDTITVTCSDTGNMLPALFIPLLYFRIKNFYPKKHFILNN